MVIFGCGGHGKVVVDALFSQGLVVDLVVDDAPSLKRFLGIEVVPSDQFITCHLPKRFEFIVAIGDNRKRRVVYERLKAVGGHPKTVIHSSSTVSSMASIGNGCFINAGATINADARIGENCIINTLASVDHDCSIGDDCHLAPGTHIAASITIETGCFIGTGTSIIPERRIGSFAVVGAGSVVTRDIPPSSTSFGNPARVQK